MHDNIKHLESKVVKSHQSAHVPLQEHLKEVFLSIFVLFFRLKRGPWPPAMKAQAHAAAICISLVEGAVGLSVFSWAQVLIGYRAPYDKVTIPLFGILIMVANEYFLVTKENGISFERNFRNFSSIKRRTLLSIAIAIVIASGVIFYFSFNAYQSAFNIHSPVW